MAAQKKDHFAQYEKAEHVKSSSSSGSGGSCVTGPHNTSYEENDSCSYRWQGVRAYGSGNGTSHVGGRPNRYTTPMGLGAAETSRYVTAATREKKRKRYFPPGNYPARLPAPEHEMDWRVTGPAKRRVIKDPETKREIATVAKGDNFKGWLWPYWNNAHHLISKGTLKKAIEERDTTLKNGWKLSVVIEKFLLKSKYNVNHWKNVILLPMDKEVGARVKLPRHLILEVGEEEIELADLGDEKRSHKAYDIMVKNELVTILDEFEKAAQKVADNKCVSGEVKASKNRLESLSDDCNRAVLDLGSLGLGQPISFLSVITAS
jgi:A nuclease family of the HNH/ENDO VII superfamily with conserved AHH